MAGFSKMLVGMSFLYFVSVANALAPGEVPVFKINGAKGTVKFAVKATVPMDGVFDRWDATLTYKSAHVEDGVLDVKIQADSVNTGNVVKDSKLKSKDFFDVEQDPYITFHSTKIVQTGSHTFEVPGTLTIHGISKSETLNLTVTGARESNHGEISGTMSFDRKDFGMNSPIRFITIADRIEVSGNLTIDRVSGPPLIFKQ